MKLPWAIVLAGGQGVRLRPYIRQFYSDERPKQFAKIVGSKSLLRHTLDRVALKIAPAQTVIVACQEHSRYLREEFSERPAQHVLAQPSDRGTAAGILLPAHWIHAMDPDAVIAVFPSDHFILDDRGFMDHIMRVTAFVRREPDRLVLLGARATEAETEYGWIEPGEPIRQADGGDIRLVRRFWEKPFPDVARTCLLDGYLWNTLVFVVKASTLVDLGGKVLPAVTERLTRVARLLTARFIHEAEYHWAAVQTADFSRTILERCPSELAVSPLPAMIWSDLGTPRRLMQTLRLLDSRQDQHCLP